MTIATEDLKACSNEWFILTGVLIAVELTVLAVCFAFLKDIHEGLVFDQPVNRGIELVSHTFAADNECMRLGAEVERLNGVLAQAITLVRDSAEREQQSELVIAELHQRMTARTEVALNAQSLMAELGERMSEIIARERSSQQRINALQRQINDTEQPPPPYARESSLFPQRPEQALGLANPPQYLNTTV